MSIARITQLREQRAKLVHDIRAILDADSPSDEDFGRADELFDAEAKLKTQIDALERALDLEAETTEAADARAGREGVSSEEVIDRDHVQAEAFRNYFRYGLAGLNDAERTIVSGLRVTGRDMPQGALTTGTGSSGGYTIPTEFRKKLTEALLAYGGMRRAGCEILSTSHGRSIEIPTENDTSNVGQIVAESTQETTEAEPTFGQVILGAYKYSSKIIRIPLELLQDSAFDLDSYVARKFKTRIGRITNTHFTTGTGSGQPNGVVTGSTLGKTGATGQTTTVIYDDLVDLQHSVDSDYRDQGNCKFMFNDSTLKALKKLKDASAELPAWVPGIALREPDTILGDPYVINSAMATMAASAKSILYGDFSNYIIRDVSEYWMFRLTELYAQYGQVGFLLFSRHDGDIVNAGTNPIKYYANPAS